MESNIKLANSDETFFKSIPGCEELMYRSDGIYHTILVLDQSAGVVGYIPGKTLEVGFVQIALLPEYRRKGLVKIAEDALVTKYNLKKLFATVENENAASLNAHLKSGFKELPQEEISSLQQKGFLEPSQTRLVKDYN